jgi:pimeloyl-ACP methyl ester carboxylesterase
MKTILSNVAFCALLAPALHAQDITGDWHGTLKSSGPEFRIVIHIAKGDNGALKGTFDSVDQGAKGVPLTSVTLDGSNFKFTIDVAKVTYAGKVNADTISGTWSQAQSLPLEFERGPFKTPKAAKPSDIDGTWSGTLDLGSQKLLIVFHIVNTEDGLTATADSPDQGAKGMGVKLTRDGLTLKLELTAVGAVFDGKIAADLKTISGTFTQGGHIIPLALSPTKETAQRERRSRPQNPVKPYPYREEEVSYDNTVQDVHLAATITIPPGSGPFPAVLLITGSGPQDRDETLPFQHKPFLVLADYLTRHGIVVLRADDRGVGKSSGNFAAATTADFATDSEAGIAYLKKRPEVNVHKLGLIGHSEGGVVAPMVAARNADVSFIVMMAGPGVRGDEIIPAQLTAIMEAGGAGKQEAEKAAADERELLILAEREKDDAVIQRKIQELSNGRTSETQAEAQAKQIRSPWYQYFLHYDPATALARVKCPVLAINGEKDRQVPPNQNLPAIRKALELGGNTHFEVDELPGLNHLFQTAKTGSPMEYAEIEETVSPVALEKISGWILKQ